MKRTVELDTVEIADELNNLAEDATVIALAVIGSEESRLDPLARLAYELSDKIRAVSDKVLPNGGDEAHE